MCTGSTLFFVTQLATLNRLRVFALLMGLAATRNIIRQPKQRAKLAGTQLHLLRDDFSYPQNIHKRAKF
jgi:hypothetical protein